MLALPTVAELWTALINTSHDIIIVATTDGTIQYINRSVEGIRIDDAVGSSLYDYIPLAEHERLGKMTQEVISSGEERLFEISGTGAFHSTAQYETRMVPVKRDGEVVGLLLVTTDVTERKQLEKNQELLMRREQCAREKAQTAETKLSNILASITDGFFSIDNDWCLAYANEQAAQLVKMRPSDRGVLDIPNAITNQSS